MWLHVELLCACVYRHTSGGRWRNQWTVWRTHLFWNQKVSLGWAVQKSWSSGVKSRGKPFFLLWPRHGCERLSCNGWAEPNNASIQPWFVLLPVIENRGSRWSSLWNFGARFWTGGFSRESKPRWRAKLYASSKCWGAEGCWCRSIYHLCRIHMSPLGRVWNLGSVTFVSQSSACGSWLGVSHCSLSCVVSCTGGVLIRSTCLFYSSQFPVPLISFCGPIGCVSKWT